MVQGTLVTSIKGAFETNLTTVGSCSDYIDDRAVLPIKFQQEKGKIEGSKLVKMFK